MAKTNSFLPGTFFSFLTGGIPGGIPLASSCVWTGVATAPCFGVATGVSGIEPPTLEVCGKKYQGNQVSTMSFTQVFQAVTFLGWWVKWPVYPGKVTSNVDKKDHDLNHLDNGVIFPICCTKTNGVAARFFGKTFLNSSGCQCWNMWSQEM